MRRLSTALTLILLCVSLVPEIAHAAPQVTEKQFTASTTCILASGTISTPIAPDPFTLTLSAGQDITIIANGAKTSDYIYVGIDDGASFFASQLSLNSNTLTVTIPADGNYNILISYFTGMGADTYPISYSVVEGFKKKLKKHTTSC
jgi:hypothetical protein